MARWTLNQAGVANFVTWDPKAETLLQSVLASTHGVNKFIQVSDYGYQEDQRRGQNAEEQLAAEQKMKLPDNARGLLGEYYRLKLLKPEQRTPEQESRWAAVNTWYNAFYRPNMELIKTSVDNKKRKRSRKRPGERWAR